MIPLSRSKQIISCHKKGTVTPFMLTNFLHCDISYNSYWEQWDRCLSGKLKV